MTSLAIVSMFVVTSEAPCLALTHVVGQTQAPYPPMHNASTSLIRRQESHKVSNICKQLTVRQNH